ncbi:MAG: bifunctional phosphatase PAP2/diacylglycerol kinase family protein [Nitriliruptoraceae bacterium]
MRRADLSVFRTVARTELPVLGPLLPPLSRAANRSRLWFAIAGLLAVGGGREGRRAATRGLAAIGLASAVTNLPIKLLAGRDRPDRSVVPEIRHLARVPTSTSFPSGHSASAFAFATAVGLERPRLRPVMLPLAAAVAVSRVYTGVHYPGDVLVGSAMGVLLARATLRGWPLLDRVPATAAPAEASAPLPERYGTGVVLVENVGAGSVLTRGARDQLQAALPGLRSIQAEPGEDLAATLERAAGTARVLATAGGDGTSSAGAAAAHRAGIALVPVPTGTLNHLARDLGIDEVSAAVAAIRGGRLVSMDLGVIDGRTFVDAAAVGSYPHLLVWQEALEPRLGRWPATAWVLARFAFRGEPFELEIDGRPRRVWAVFIGNGTYLADGIAPARRRRLDDGLLDVRLVGAERRWARSRLLLSMLSGRLHASAVYERWTAAQVQVRSSQGPLRLAWDGESAQGPEAFTIEKRPRALLVLQPPEAGAG